MSTQKQKFELFARLSELGFTYEEATQLRRISMALHRWAELECGDSNDFSSWCISRDDETGKPFMEVHPHREGKVRRYAVADRESGALRRLKAIVDARNKREGEPSSLAQSFGLSRDLIPFHQTDPRGCALYLVKANDLPNGDREQIDSCYNRGLAVCA